MNNHPQAPQGNPPCTCCEVTPDQPQSAMMAASYHTGGTMIQPPPYQSFPGNDENVHSRMITPWHRSYSHPNNWHAPGAPPPASLQQRRDPPFQRGTAQEYSNFQSSQDLYAANHSLGSEPRGWIGVWRNESRSTVQESDAQSQTTVPHLHPSPAYQHSNSIPEYPAHSNQPDQVLRAFQHLEIRNPSMGCLAPATAPALATATQGSAPVADLLNHPLHTNDSFNTQSVQPMSWAAVPGPLQHPSLSTSTLTNSTNHPWGLNSENNSFVSPSLEYGWPHETHFNSGSYRGQDLPAPQAAAGHHQHALHSSISTRTHPQENAAFNRLTSPRVPNRHKPKLLKMSSSMTPRQAKNKIARRGKPLSLPQKQNAAVMRKIGTCIRCKMFHVGCDPGRPCRRCEVAAPNARNFKAPCCRDNLSETHLVRHCNGRLGQREAEFVSYKFIDGIIIIEFMWNLPGSGPIPNSYPLSANASRYFVKEHDATASMWSTSNGQINSVEQPAYAVVDTARLILVLERYFLDGQMPIEQWLFRRIQHDEIASRTYAEVIRLRQKGKGSDLLRLVMQIQCLSIVSQGYGTVHNNIPGIREVDHRRLGSSNYEAYNRNSCDRPLPTGMSNQIDVALLKGLKKLEKACVKEISKQVFKPKIKPWYELFLAFFVLFYNLDYIHHGAEKYILSKTGTSTETQVSSVVSSQIEKWDSSFPIIMQYWPAILRGFQPFQLARENPEELREKGPHVAGEERATLDAEGMKYVVEMSRIFDRMGPIANPPPLTGHASTQHSLGSEWIVKLFKTAGA